MLKVFFNCAYLQQTKAKYEIEAEKRELARLLEKRTQEVENLTGWRFVTQNMQNETNDAFILDAVITEKAARHFEIFNLFIYYIYLCSTDITRKQKFATPLTFM